MISLFLRHPFPLTSQARACVLPFKRNTDCFSCLFTTHGSAALRNRLFLPRTIWRISWIKMILIISQWKDPWQLWIPLEADQRLLVAHFYGQSNSIGPAWVTKDAGGLHSSVFIIYPPSSFLYIFNFYGIMHFWSPEAPLCVLLLRKNVNLPRVNLHPRYRNKKWESHCAFGSFLSTKGSGMEPFTTLPPSDTLDLHGGNSRGVEDSK